MTKRTKRIGFQHENLTFEEAKRPRTELELKGSKGFQDENSTFEEAKRPRTAFELQIKKVLTQELNVQAMPKASKELPLELEVKKVLTKRIM